MRSDRDDPMPGHQAAHLFREDLISIAGPKVPVTVLLHWKITRGREAEFVAFWNAADIGSNAGHPLGDFLSRPDAMLSYPWPRSVQSPEHTSFYNTLSRPHEQHLLDDPLRPFEAAPRAIVCLRSADFST